MSFWDAIKALKKVFGQEQVPKKKDCAEKATRPDDQLMAKKTEASSQNVCLPKKVHVKEEEVFVKKFNDFPQRQEVVNREIIQPPEAAKQSSVRTDAKFQRKVTSKPAPQPEIKPKKQLIIGFDFGTAFTKVVIREQRVCYAVPFNAPGLKNIYLLPGEMQVGADDRCLFGWEAGRLTVKDMKMKLLEELDTHDDHVDAAAFMGLVLRHCRNWLLSAHGSTYESFDLDWYVNIGLPTASYHDQALKERYRRIALAGWALCLDTTPITRSLAGRVYKDVMQMLPYAEGLVNYKPGMLHPESIGLFPEFVAQIVGYVKSPLRKSDLHILMDVGAGTVDLSIFNVYEKDGEDSFPIFSKDVKPLGTQFLCRHRIQQAGQSASLTPGNSQLVPKKTDFAKLIGATLKELEEIDKPFGSQIRHLLNDQLTHTKAKRYSRSPRWSTGVPVFLCGGGSQVGFYSDIIESIEANTNHTKRIRREALPKPSNLKAPKLLPEDYDRLSVAFGLSFDAFDIGQIILSNDIEDDDYDVPVSSPVRQYVGQEMV